MNNYQKVKKAVSVVMKSPKDFFHTSFPIKFRKVTYSTDSEVVYTDGQSEETPSSTLREECQENASDCMMSNNSKSSSPNLLQSFDIEPEEEWTDFDPNFGNDEDDNDGVTLENAENQNPSPKSQETAPITKNDWKDWIFDEFELPEVDLSNFHEHPELFLDLNDKLLLQDCAPKEKWLLYQTVLLIRKKTKQFVSERVKNPCAENISVQEVQKEVPGVVRYLVKHLITSENHRKKHVKPFLSLMKNYKASGTMIEGQDRVELQKHLESIQKKLCSTVVLSNMIVNACNPHAPTSLKILASVALREENLSNSGISSLHGIGLTVQVISSN